MLNLQPVVISGAQKGMRSSLFAQNATMDAFSGNRGGPALGQPASVPQLGQIEQDWYNRAVRAVARYDELVNTTRHIANRPVRESIFRKFVGDPANDASGFYRRNSVQDDINEAEGFAPVNYLVFNQRRNQNRVGKLEDIVHNFRQDVREAEMTYGLLPEPQLIEVAVMEVPGWVAPVVIAAGVVTLGAVLGILD